MSQVVTKFIADLAISTAKVAANAVTDAKVRLTNAGYLRGRNAADSADVNMLRVNASDRVEFPSVPQIASGTPSAAADIATVGYVAGVIPTSKTWGNEKITLVSGDITNQYVDFAQVAVTGSVELMINGLIMRPVDDYTLNYTGGAGGKTRLTFAGDIATGGAAALVATDVLYISYEY